MERQTKTVEILRKRERRYGKFTVGDIITNPNILPTDRISFDVVDAYDYGDSAYDGHSDIVITREVDYSDEEQIELEVLLEAKKRESQRKRYCEFLLLKAEFELGSFAIDPMTEDERNKVVAEYQEELARRERRKVKNNR